MKIICTQENLQKGLSIVSQTVKKTATLPILSNVLFSCEEGKIKLSTTNLEMGMTCFIRGKIEKGGKITVPAHLIYSYISNLPQTNVLLESKNGILNLECENFKAQVKSLDPSEFPLIPKIDGEALCKIKSEDFRKALSCVVFAAAPDEIRPEIAGVYFKIGKDNIRLAATDSYRLAEKVIKNSQTVNKEAVFIVPKITMTELLRLLTKNMESEVLVFASENQIKFAVGETEFISRLVDGQYPDYLKIIPENFSTKLKINTDEFTNALRSASLFSKIDGNEAEIEVKPKTGEMKIYSESGQVGKNVAVLRGQGEGKEEKIFVNYQYVLEGMQAADSEEINLLFSGDIGPVQLKPEGDQNYTYIIMPIKK
jgi:DNA polymerase-3 subunit beta